jgi:hypothetical protein
MKADGGVGSGCIDPHYLDLGTIWRQVVNFMHCLLYPPRKDPRASLDNVEKRKFLTIAGLELRPLDHPACSQLLY